MISCLMNGDSLKVTYNKTVLIKHSPQSPFITLGKGLPDIDMYRGNFFIEDHISECVELTAYSVSEHYEDGGLLYYRITFSDASTKTEITCRLAEREGRLTMSFSPLGTSFNRLMVAFFAHTDEHVYGCGEQFSCFDLRGKNFPLWTQEQGVGRNKQTGITQIADKEDRAGGDYHTTFYPQPTFVSSRNYFLHAETYGYADFDFSHPERHILTFWEVPQAITISAGSTLLKTVQDISKFLGRQPELPDWVYDGIILGMQGGTDTCLEKLEQVQAAGMKVSGVWAQDWQGENYTSFGKRLRWNWQWDEKLYPNLDQTIPKLNETGVRFLGYINPYVAQGHALFLEAEEKNLLALNEHGEVYLVDFGEFYAGIVDFTNPVAYDWYKGVIKTHLIDFGLSGWMADFGEYLPTDVVLFNGDSPMTAHNAWPGIWAKNNRDAIDESEKRDDLLYFMRAGNARSLAYCPMMWAGDQNVDWSEDDGLPSVITAALSLAMSGMGLHHSDIGGYTTLYGMARTKELLLRWAEFCVFTPMMRTHEGNRPKDNWQFDGDAQTITELTKMVDIHVALKPYLKDAVQQNAQMGTPVMRPVFLHYSDERFADCKTAYLLGRDVFVSPVTDPGTDVKRVYLPEDEWIHLYTGDEYAAGSHLIAAPLGRPPVFYRKSSKYRTLFERITQTVS